MIVPHFSMGVYQSNVRKPYRVAWKHMLEEVRFISLNLDYSRLTFCTVDGDGAVDEVLDYFDIG